MSTDNDFWKDLMGDDFDSSAFFDDDDDIKPDAALFDEPQNTQPPIESFGGDATINISGINIETVNNSGEIVNSSAKSSPAKSGNGGAARDDDGDTGPADFKVNFDFEREYENGRANIPVKRNRQRRTGCLGGILYFVFVVAISLALAAFGWVCAEDVLALGKDKAPVSITLPEYIFHEEEYEETDDDGKVIGTGVRNVAEVDDLAEILYDNGLIKYKWLFKIYGDFSHAGRKVAPGSYELNTNYDYRALVSGMTARTGMKVEVEITIPEGFTLQQIFETLAGEKVCTVADLKEAATNHDFGGYSFLDKSTLGDSQRLEGFLFPDTYKFYVGDDPVRVITKMLSNFETKWTSDFEERASVLGYSTRDIINIASMIEKEAAGDSERATIASVIYNRLNNQGSFPHLGIDATIYYAMSLTGEEFSTDLNSPYNTYVCNGLPAGPIANPGLASIRAALYPESTDYYFYALSVKGTHEFFKGSDAFTTFVNSDEYGG